MSAGLLGIIKAGRSVEDKALPDRVAIYANYGLASYWLMPRLTLYQRSNPDTEIAVRTVEKVHRLSETEPEIAFRFGAGSWDDGEARLLFKELGFPVCSPGYLEGKPHLRSV